MWVTDRCAGCILEMGKFGFDGQCWKTDDESVSLMDRQAYTALLARGLGHEYPGAKLPIVTSYKSVEIDESFGINLIVLIWKLRHSDRWQSFFLLYHNENEESSSFLSCTWSYERENVGMWRCLSNLKFKFSDFVFKVWPHWKVV